MPNWKKLVVSGSDAALNSLNVANAITASNFKGDGTDITGVISSSYSTTSSLGLNNITAASVNVSTITFTKGNGSTFDITVSQSGSVEQAISSSYAETAATASYSDNFYAVSASVSSFSASYIDLDVLANGDIPPHKAGRIFFGAEDGALEVYNEEADITLQVGQEFWVRAYNKSGGTILNGTPVRASGSQGDRIGIYPALSPDHSTESSFENHILGLATHDIGVDEEGYVTAQGVVRGVDTSGFNAGDILYLQTGSAGLRNSPPPFPYDIIQVGYVARSASPNGFIFVEPKEPVHFNNISGLSGSVDGVGDLWIYQANNAWSPGRVLSGSYVINNGGLTANSFTGSLLGTASYAVTASYAISASHEITFELSSSHAEVADEVPFTGITGKPTLLSGSAQIATEISGSFTLVSSSIASDISDIIDGTTTITSASYALTASYIDPTYISASAADAGFSQTGVTSIVAGEGISIDQSTGTVTISATPGVVPGTIITSSFSNVTSTFYNHNFNSKNIIAKIYDTDSNEIIPNSLTLTSNDRIDASFANPQSGYMVIIKGTNLNSVTGSYTNSLTSSITHGLVTRELNVSVYDENYNLVLPDTLTIPDFQSIETTFSSPSTGTVVAIAKENRIFETFIDQSSVTISNPFNSLNVVVGVYDLDFSTIIPDSIQVTTSDIDIEFAVSSSGNLVVAGGHIDATNITLSTSFKTGISGASTYNLQHNLDEEFPIVQVYESSSRAQVTPQSIVSLDEDTIQLVFSGSFAGYVIINS